MESARDDAKENCGHPKAEACLLSRLACAAETELDTLENCEMCPRTVAELDNEVRLVGGHLRRADSGQFPNLSSLLDVRAKPFNRNVNSHPERLSPEIGVYVLREFLGEDAVGAVYRATHKLLKKDVAIKLISDELTSRPSVAFQLEHEIRAIGKLEHPYLVSVTDAGESNGNRFVVTELIRGTLLSTILQQVECLGLADACEVARQVAVGLAFAHEHDLVHCDVQPSNLMLDFDSQEQACVKVMDLGLSKVFQMSLRTDSSERRDLLKSIAFMAPEVAAVSDKIDRRADVYSLGTTLWNMLTGQTPERMNSHASQPQLPDELVDLIRRMMMSDPGDRPNSMEIVIESLAPLCEGHDLKQLVGQLKPESVSVRPFGLSTEATRGVCAIKQHSDGLNEQSPASFAETQPVENSGAVSPAIPGGPRGSLRVLLWLASLSVLAIASVAWFLSSISSGGYLLIQAKTPVRASFELVQGDKVVDLIDLGPQVTPVPKWYPSGAYQLRRSGSSDQNLQLKASDFTLGENKTHVIEVIVMSNADH